MFNLFIDWLILSRSLPITIRLCAQIQLHRQPSRDQLIQETPGTAQRWAISLSHDHLRPSRTDTIHDPSLTQHPLKIYLLWFTAVDTVLGVRSFHRIDHVVLSQPFEDCFHASAQLRSEPTFHACPCFMHLHVSDLLSRNNVLKLKVQLLN